MLLLIQLVIFAVNWLEYFPDHFPLLLRFRPRILVDVSRINLSTTVLGYKISAAVMVAPTGMHKLAHPEGPNLLGRVLSLS